MRNFLLFLLMSALFVAPSHAAVKTGGPDGAGGEKTVPISSVWSGITGIFDGLWDDSDDEGGAETSKIEEDKTIKVKRLDDELKAKNQAKRKVAKKDSAPYKIYQAPMVADRAFPDWAQSAPAPEASFSAHDRTPPVREESNIVMPPVAAFPKQFFPILPLGSSKGTLPQFLPVASNVPLQQDHLMVRRVIIYIHDVARNAAQNIAMLTTLGGSNTEHTLMIAPQFPLEVDIKRFADHLPQKGRHIARWSVAGGWAEGGVSLSRQGGLSSFTALDVLMMFLADRVYFPNLQDVVIVGHGMGADFVQRYAVAGMAPDLLIKDKITVHFAVANASSYLYFTNQRPLGTGQLFGRPKNDACQGGNAYPYGLSGLAPYPRRTGAEALRLRYPSRRVTYIVGDKIENDNYLDRSCSAMLQGETRILRAQAFARHIMQSFGRSAISHKFHAIRNGGYDPVAMFGSSCGLSILFVNGQCE